MVNNDNHRSNLASLQILRALAAISVVYYHAAPQPRFGSFGVDIFFVISGFVMGMLVINLQSSGAFIIKRLARIVPMYWTMTTIVLILTLIKPDILNSTQFNIINYLKSLFFIPYFKNNGLLQPMLGVGWTLNYEMFFYVVIWLSFSISRKFCIYLTSAIIIFIYIIFGNWISNELLNSFFGNSQIFEFILGLIAFSAYNRELVHKTMVILNLFIILAIYFCMAYIEIHGIHYERIFLYGLFSFVIVLLATSSEKQGLKIDYLPANFLTTIGDASYSIYLTHTFVIDSVERIFFKNYTQFYTPMFALIFFYMLPSLIVGYILYLTLDKPLYNFFKTRLMRLLSIVFLIRKKT